MLKELIERIRRKRKGGKEKKEMMGYKMSLRKRKNKHKKKNREMKWKGGRNKERKGRKLRKS